MKPSKMFFLFIFIFNILLIINSNDNLSLFKKLYYKADTLHKKYSILEKMENIVTDEFSDFITKIVIDQSNYNYTILQTKDYENWIIANAKLISKLKIIDATQYLEKIYYKCKAPNAKAQILLTIAQTGDEKYLPWLNNILHNIIILHRENKFIEQEEIVQSIVIGLEIYTDESSFENLLYVAMPRFSDKTQELAIKAINKITNNPAKICSEIISNNPNYDIKLDALNFAIKSNSPDEDKINTCKTTLIKMSGVATETVYKDKRKALLNYSIKYLGEKKVKDKDVIDLIEEKWDNENEYYSILTNIEALEKIGTDNAAKVLIKKLSYWHERKKENIKDGYFDNESQNIIIALIKALGIIKYPESLDILYDIIGTDGYGDTIIREASKSIDLIINKIKK